MKSKAEKMRKGLIKLGKINLCSDFNYYNCMKQYEANRRWCPIKKVCRAMSDRYGK